MADIHLSLDGQACGFASFSMMLALLKMMKATNAVSPEWEKGFKDASLHFVQEFFASRTDVPQDFQTAALAAQNLLEDVLGGMFPE